MAHDKYRSAVGRRQPSDRAKRDSRGLDKYRVLEADVLRDLVRGGGRKQHALLHGAVQT